MQVAFGIFAAQLGCRFHRQAAGDVTVERVVGAGLVGEQVGDDAALGQRGDQVGAVAHQTDRDRFLFPQLFFQDAQRLVEVVDHDVAVAAFDAALDAGGIDFDAEEAGAVHSGGQRLGAAHSAQTTGGDQLAAQVAAKVALAGGGKSLKRALDDALRADVNPTAGGHLAVHHQPGALQLAEVLPVRPVTHQVGVGNQDARRPLMGAEDSHRLAGLNQQSFVIAQTLQRADDGAEAVPVAGGLAGAAIDDQFFRPLGHFGVEVVHQHA